MKNIKSYFYFIFLFISISILFPQNLSVKKIATSKHQSGFYKIDIKKNDNSISILYQNTDQEKSYEYIFNNENLIPQINQIDNEIAIKSILIKSKKIIFNINQFPNFNKFYQASIYNNSKEIYINHIPIMGLIWYKNKLTDDIQYKFNSKKVEIYVTTEDEKSILIDKNKHQVEELITPLGFFPFIFNNEEFYLIPFSKVPGTSSGDYFFRIYDPSYNLRFQSDIVGTYFPAKFIEPIVIDLNNDNNDEIIVFSHDMSVKNNFTIYSIQISQNQKPILQLDPKNKRMHSEYVYMLQEILKHKGYKIGSDGIDGWYGNDTFNAVIQFQGDNDLLKSGVVDELTWSLLVNNK